MAKPVNYYRFVPSFPAAVVAAVLFTIIAIGTLGQFFRYRSWVWTVMVLAVGMESAGYILRCISVKNVYNKDIFVASYSLIVLSPVLMAAACYIVFGRIVFLVVPKEARTARLLWAPPRFVTPIFVGCDIFALLLQLFGAVLITTVNVTDSKASTKLNLGKRIAQIGVAVQLVGFGLFTVIAIRFHFTSKRFRESFEQRLGEKNGEKNCTIDGGEKKLNPNWQTILFVTNFASVMILIRSIYRMVDFTLGKTGYTGSHEWCWYVFDALVMLPAMALYVWYHPSMYLPYLGFRLPKHAR